MSSRIGYPLRRSSQERVSRGKIAPSITHLKPDTEGGCEEVNEGVEGTHMAGLGRLGISRARDWSER